MMKKITLALLAILGSASALAGHADDMALPAASGVNLTAPHQEGSWSFGVQANYFEPNNDLNYAYATQTNSNLSNVTTNEARTYALNSDYDWGWGADITYHFPGEGRDVTLAYTQLNTSDNDSVDTDDSTWTNINGVGLYPSSTKIGSISTPGAFNTAEGKVSTDYDAVDLTFGQVITAGNRITLHPFAGLRYAMIDYDATSVYSSFDTNGDLSQQFTGKLKSDFDGVGPRLGSDAAVNLGAGFSLHGTLGISLLVGSMDVDTKATNIQYSGTTINSETDGVHDVDTNTRVVPEADAELSAMYHMDFNNGYGLGFQAGWQVTNYFDAIQNNTVSSTLDTSTEYTNFFMQGPYARVQLDVA